MEAKQIILTSLITSIFTILGFALKELYERRREEKKQKKEKLDQFSVYGYPLITAAESLLHRLQEVFLTRPRFLRKDAPDIEFYQYNYVSTLYRLCAVLGWIRAIRLDFVGMNISGKSVNKKIEEAISNFQDALASNHLSPGAQLAYLLERWEIDGGNINTEEAYQIEKEIEKIVWEFLDEKKADRANALSEDDQMELLKKVYCKITSSLETEDHFDEEKMKQYLISCISVVSRRVSWIYKDWQKAIGDFMLERVSHEGSLRRFELMPFQEFEDLYLDFLVKPEDHRWLERVNRIFYDLKPGTSEILDARSQQLKNITEKLFDLVQALWNAGIGQENIGLDEMSRFQEKQKLINE